MGKPKLTTTKSWNEMPITMTIDEVSEYLGIGRPVVEKWFRDKTFPKIPNGTKKVEKFLLRGWLYKKDGKGVEELLIKENAIETILKIIKCDDLTSKEMNQ